MLVRTGREMEEGGQEPSAAAAAEEEGQRRRERQPEQPEGQEEEAAAPAAADDEPLADEAAAFETQAPPGALVFATQLAAPQPQPRQSCNGNGNAAAAPADSGDTPSDIAPPRRTTRKDKRRVRRYIDAVSPRQGDRGGPAFETQQPPA